MGLPPTGLNMEPGQSYGLEDRFVCRKCGISPRVVKAAINKDSGMLEVQLSCHGETTSWTGSKSDLYHNKEVFEVAEVPPESE